MNGRIQRLSLDMNIQYHVFVSCLVINLSLVPVETELSRCLMLHQRMFPTNSFPGAPSHVVSMQASCTHNIRPFRMGTLYRPI